jgi:hypothetical protein
MAILKIKDANGNWQVVKDPSSASQNADITLLKEQMGDIDVALKDKQDKLTFDNKPTNGSQNPVTSDGVFKEFYEFSTAYNKIIGEVKTESKEYTDSELQSLANSQNEYLSNTITQFEQYMDEKHVSKEEFSGIEDTYATKEELSQASYEIETSVSENVNEIITSFNQYVTETYSTKEEIGDIDTALDSITEIQEDLMDGNISVTGGTTVVVTKITDTTVELTLDNNTEYRCVNPVESLTINGFSPVADDVSALWSIIFTTADTIALNLPDSIIWAIADPVFEPSKTYWLSFVPFNSKYLGVWTVADATVFTEEASINE